MRRIFFLLTVLLISLYCSYASSEIVCTCELEPCICFLQEGDEGPAVVALREELKLHGYLDNEYDGNTFTLTYTNALKQFQKDHDLSPTGVADDFTLTWLLWGMSPAEVDAAFPNSSSQIMWVAVNGGKRAHRDFDCKRSSRFEMRQPRMVSLRNVYKLGVQPCKICSKDLFIQK